MRSLGVASVLAILAMPPCCRGARHLAARPGPLGALRSCKLTGDGSGAEPYEAGPSPTTSNAAASWTLRNGSHPTKANPIGFLLFPVIATSDQINDDKTRPRRQRRMTTSSNVDDDHRHAARDDANPRQMRGRLRAISANRQSARQPTAMPSSRGSLLAGMT